MDEEESHQFVAKQGHHLVRRSDGVKVVDVQEMGRDLNDPSAWPEAVREFAFELYFTECGRFMHTLYQKLRTDYRMPVPRSVLEEWKIRYDWDHEADTRLMAFAPILQTRTDLTVMSAAEKSARYLDAVVSGGIKIETGRINAAKALMEFGGYGKGRKDPRTPGEILTAELRDGVALIPLGRMEKEGIAARLAALTGESSNQLDDEPLLQDQAEPDRWEE